MLITVGGQMVRIAVSGVREAGRNTQGVKLIDLAEGDKLQAIAPVIAEEHEESPEIAP
jgi:DNA gyrase subunit A